MPRLTSWDELSKPETVQEGWIVKQVQGSATKPYTVRVRADRASCTCKASEFGTLCKHIKEVRKELGLTSDPILEVGGSDE